MFSRSNHLLICCLWRLNIRHKDWLTYCDGANRPGELCYNISISNDLTQMVNSYSTFLVLLFWIYLFLDASICSTMAFPLLGNSDHLVVSVSIDFPSNSKRDSPFHRIAYDYSPADRDSFVIIREMFHGRISLNSVLLLLLVNFVSGCRLKLMYISLIEISGQASLISLVFSCLCCCLISKKSLFSFLSKG